MLLILIVCPCAIALVGKDRKALRDDLVKRYKSWLLLAPLMGLPVLCGAFWTFLAVGLLSVLSHREFARATGLFRDRLTSALVVLCIFMITFTTLDNWLGFFLAIPPLGTVLIAAVNVFPDKPKGYLQRVGLGVLSLALFGSGIGHLGMIANDSNYRAIILWLIFSVQMNDVFAYVAGKSFGKKRILPETSPGKTLGGALGALILTTIMAACLALVVFRGTALERIPHAIALGLMISVLGQLGDLVVSSVKRDVGIKDMGNLFPGHGGLLDRFDSLILVAPAVFHYVNYFVGIGLTQPTRILSHSW